MMGEKEGREPSTAAEALLVALEQRPSEAEFSAIMADPRFSALPSAVTNAVRSLNAELRAARVRQTLLRALFDTAIDLTSIRDPEQVMATVVRRTRAVLGTDMAYLSLNDYERNETFIRETDGVATQAYRNIRMPLGTGVLGSVAHSNGPSQTSNYMNDPSLLKLDHINRAVEDEGVKAILGAPLRIGGRVIGALMVANRNVHTFTQDQIDAVEAMASHAAIVYENARLFREMAASLRHTEQAHRNSQEYVAQLEYLAKAEHALLTALASMEGTQRFGAELSELLGRRAWILDMDLPLASQELPQIDEHLLDRLITESAASGEPADGARSVDGARVTVMAASIGQRIVGGIAIDGTPEGSTALILRRAAVTLAALLSFTRALRETEFREQTELLEDLVTARPNRDNTSLLRNLVPHGLSPGQQICIATVDVASNERERAFRRLSRLTRGNGLAAIHGGHVCMISRRSDPEAFASELISELGNIKINATIGCDGPVTFLAELPQAHDNASKITLALGALGRAGEGASKATLGSIGLLLGGTGPTISRSMFTQTIRPVLDYDAAKGTDLSRTALEFLDSNMNIPQTAAKLQIHVNTARQRIDRVDMLLGPHWRQGTKTLDTHLALRIWQMSHFL
jgi:GAF domain-containing protein